MYIEPLLCADDGAESIKATTPAVLENVSEA
jgi:hypothetical protein